MERDHACADLSFSCQSGMCTEVIHTSFQMVLINQIKQISAGTEKHATLLPNSLLPLSALICCHTRITEINQFAPDRQALSVRTVITEKTSKYALTPHLSFNQLHVALQALLQQSEHCDLPKPELSDLRQGIRRG